MISHYQEQYRFGNFIIIEEKMECNKDIKFIIHFSVHFGHRYHSFGRNAAIVNLAFKCQNYYIFGYLTRSGEKDAACVPQHRVKDATHFLFFFLSLAQSTAWP